MAVLLVSIFGLTVFEFLTILTIISIFIGGWIFVKTKIAELEIKVLDIVERINHSEQNLLETSNSLKKETKEIAEELKVKTSKIAVELQTEVTRINDKLDVKIDKIDSKLDNIINKLFDFRCKEK